MKSLLLKSMAVITAFAMNFTLSSCGDDNDEPQGPSTPTSSVTDYVLTSYIRPNTDMLTYFDIQVTYVANTGEVKTTMFNAAEFSQNDHYTPANIPATLVFKAVAIPKSSYPAIDPAATYTLRADYYINFSGYDNNGTCLSTAGMYSPLHYQLPTNGTHLEEALVTGRQFDLFNINEPIKK